MRKRLRHKYKIIRIVNCFRNGALYELIDDFDLILAQNIGSIMRVEKERRYKMICRMGGTRTFELTKTPFDDDMKSVAAIIATNGKLFEIGKSNNENTHLIPNGIDLELFKPRTQRCTPFDDNGKQESFMIGFAGNISGRMYSIYKGWKYYTQATQRLYGEGFRTLNALYNLNQIPHDEMPEKFYHKIDCLVLPTLDEGCSNVTVEALACGVPVLTTKVGFHGERLEDGINCIFIERDIQDIMDKLVLLKNTPELRTKLAFEGKLFAETWHNIDVIASSYDKIFQSVLKQNEGQEGV